MYGGISGLFWLAFFWSLRTLNTSLDASIWDSSVAYSLFSSMCHFLSVLFGFFGGYLLEFFILFAYYPSIGCGVSEDFFPICSLLICLIDYVFCLTEFSSFMRSHLLSVFDIRAWGIGVLFRKFPLVPISSRLFLIFPSIRFSVYGFILRSLIHLDLRFLQDDSYGTIFTFLHTDSQLD